MCGIAGFVRDDRDAYAVAAELRAALAPRGPDAAWICDRPHCSLVQTRLAIIDLSDRVVYPLPNEDQSLWLLFNGEIYNYRELRQDLMTRGHRFRTQCDAEVVVHAYEEWSTDAFPRLNGIFAIALLDERRGEIVLTRDLFGVKPLVRTTSRPFAFASEVVCLVRAGLSMGEVDLSALREFVTFHYIPFPKTGVTDVRHVEPGTAIRRRFDGTERLVRWGQQPFAAQEPRDYVDLMTADLVVRDAVKRQLAADVEVGILLSGGLDSSLVLAYAVAAGFRPRCFTIGFGGYGDYDERAQAAAVARAFRVEHYSDNFSIGFEDAVEDVADAFDQPFADSSAIPMLAVSRLASKHVKVALSGTGGDDLFAGYYRHRAHRLRPLLSALPRRTLKPFGSRAARGSERRSRSALYHYYLTRLGRADTRSDTDQYLALVGNATSSESMGSLRFAVDPRVVRTAVGLRAGLERSPMPGRLRTLQRFEIATYLPGDLLVKDDRASMAFGLEARVPLLDSHVAALADATPEKQMISWLQGKLLLRRLAQQRLGSAHAKTRKRGFAVPLDALFRGPWNEAAREWFEDCDSDLIDGKAARALVEAGGPAPDLWALAALTGWEKRVRAARTRAQRLAA